MTEHCPSGRRSGTSWRSLLASALLCLGGPGGVTPSSAVSADSAGASGAAGAAGAARGAKGARSSGATEPPGEGEGFTPGPADDLSPEARAEIRARIARNVARLAAEDRLPAASAAAAGVLLGWPLRANLGPEDFDYHSITNFVDQDPASPGKLDYNCGARTRDSHGGTDIVLWPFAWNRMEQAAIDVVAGAAGVIVEKDDGNFDRNCAMGSASWNAVYVRHGDGSTAWYGHLKNGSLTAKGVGDEVAAGERLGAVASSGSSTSPHLHIELHDSADQVIDPWQGPCNSLSPDSWWSAQRAYYDSGINRLMTGFAKMVPGTCPDPDQTNEAVVFHPGETIYFTRFYRDQLDSLVSDVTIYRPDASVFASWPSVGTLPHYAMSWWTNFIALDNGEPVGKWRFEVVFAGRTYSHDFWLVGPGPWLLRDARLGSIAPLSMPLSAIFTGAGDPTLDLAGPDAVARPGEGDDDAAYVPDFSAGQEDPDATVLGDASRPLVFYQVAGIATPLLLGKSSSGGIEVRY